MKRSNLKFPKLALILGLATAFSGCAFLKEATAYHPADPRSADEIMKAETAAFQLPKLPAPEKAMVYVVRPSGVGGLVRFNVFLDDHEAESEMGYNRGSQHIYFEVLPGSHTIYSKAENWAETPIWPKAGDVIFIEQQVGFGLIMARNSISVVDEVVGKSEVMNSRLGTVIRAEKR